MALTASFSLHFPSLISLRMNEVERQFSYDFTQRLLACKLTLAFATPVSKNEDYAVDYFKIIEHPMDLSTVIKKIDANDYKRIEDWKSDIYLIWKNAMNFNKKPHLLYTIADFLQKKCDKYLAVLPHNKTELLMLRLEIANKKFAKLLAFEMPEQSSVPRIDQEINEEETVKKQKS